MRINPLVHKVFRMTGYDFRRYAPEYFPSLKRIQIINSEMISYLETLGFILVALNHVFSDPNSDRLLQVDGIFKRKQ